MTTLEDFYDYLTLNDAQIRKEILKNITYDPELFDDVYNDTVIKVAEAITKREKDIKDIRFYFFISCKQNYINAQNRKRRDMQSKTGISSLSDLEPIQYAIDENDAEDLYARAKALFNAVCARLEDEFPLNEVDIYIIYYKLNSGGKRISYQTLAEIMDVDIKYITRVIQSIKKFIREDDYLQNEKKRLML